MEAEDWYGTDQTDLNENSQGDLPFKSRWKQGSLFGDEVSNTYWFIEKCWRHTTAGQCFFGLGGYIASIPDQVVFAKRI